MPTASGVFDSPSAFETYLATLSDRLQTDREARVAFLTSAVDKLTLLLEMAQSMQSNATIAEINGHLATARAELADLQRQAP
jgi:hypothetical protein